MTLTRGQRKFIDAVKSGDGGMFHKRITDAVEKAGLVLWIGGWRLVGCNSFSARDFLLTDALTSESAR